KLILGLGDPLIGRFVVYDALKMRFRELTLPKDPDCPICGTHPSIVEVRECDASCASGPGSDRGQTGVRPRSDPGLTPHALKARIEGGAAPIILDVREPFEAAICRIPGSRLIPLGDLERRLADLDLDPRAEIVVHCKSGARSQRAVAFLRANGYASAVNLTGGILSWINEIDPSLPRY